MQRWKNKKMINAVIVPQEGKKKRDVSGAPLIVVFLPSLLLLMPLISLPSLPLLLAIDCLVKGFLGSSLVVGFLVCDVVGEVWRVDARGVGLRRSCLICLACKNVSVKNTKRGYMSSEESRFGKWEVALA